MGRFRAPTTTYIAEFSVRHCATLEYVHLADVYLGDGIDHHVYLRDWSIIFDAIRQADFVPLQFLLIFRSSDEESGDKGLDVVDAANCIKRLDNGHPLKDMIDLDELG